MRYGPGAVQPGSPNVLDRLMGICLSVLAAAVAVYVAVRLIESIAAALLVIVAAVGGLVVVSLLWRRQRADRW
jgi:ABC-type enterochelin transport system permease subunit